MGTKDYQKVVNLDGQNLENIQTKPWYDRYERLEFNFVHAVAEIHELARYTGEGEYLGGFCTIQDAGNSVEPINLITLVFDNIMRYSLGTISLYQNTINNTNALVKSIYDDGFGTIIIELTGERYFKTSLSITVSQLVATNVTYAGGINYGYTA